LLNVTVPAVCVNVATEPNVAVPPYVNDPDVIVTLVLGVIVPLVKLNVAPFTSTVEHKSVPLIVVEPFNKTRAAIVFPLPVSVPVSTIFKVTFVYEPLDDSVIVSTFIIVVDTLDEVVPKSRLLNQLPEPIVIPEAPLPNVKFGALVAVPPAVLPQLNDLVLPIAATVNPPGPVYVNPVRVAIFSTVEAAVVFVKFILLALALPNCIERVLEPLELNEPILNVIPSANISEPEDNV